MSLPVRAPALSALVLGVLLSACSVRVAVSSAIGAGVGAAAGATMGDERGALIGGGVGLAVGFLVGSALEIYHQLVDGPAESRGPAAPTCRGDECAVPGETPLPAELTPDPTQGPRLALTQGLERALGTCGALAESTPAASAPAETPAIVAAIAVEPSGKIGSVELRGEHPAAFAACVTKELSGVVLSADPERPGAPIEVSAAIPSRAP